MKCDRCNQKIIKNWWKIEIWETPDKEGKQTESGYLNNMITNLKRASKRPDIFCEQCIKEIKRYIGG